MDKRVEILLEAHHQGRLTRRDFVRQAGLILGGVTVGGLVLGGSTPDQTLAQATPEPSQMPTLDPAHGDVKLVTQMVEFPVSGPGGRTTPGYLAHPEGAGPFPGVVVIQEWWGVDAHIKSVVELMARNGYAAIAPDLYHGEVAEEPDEARKLAMALIMAEAIDDVQGAADYLTAQSYVEPKKVGVMGFCMGGRITMVMSWEGKENIGAVVTFYGGGLNPTDEQFQAVKVPVLGLYGKEDGGIPEASIRRWEAKLKEFGKINEMVIYDGAPHAFFNDTRPAFRKEAAADALQRTLAWFQKHLSGEK